MKSEVAQLKRQIQGEYLAAKHGLSGLAMSTSRHQFITKKMEKMGKYQAELEAIVGQQAAIHTRSGQPSHVRGAWVCQRDVQPGECMKQDMTVKQTLGKMSELWCEWRGLQETIILRAKLQEMAEIDYNVLATEAKKLIGHLKSVQAGDMIDVVWIAKRDVLTENAKDALKD